MPPLLQATRAAPPPMPRPAAVVGSLFFRSRRFLVNVAVGQVMVLQLKVWVGDRCRPPTSTRKWGGAGALPAGEPFGRGGSAICEATGRPGDRCPSLRDPHGRATLAARRPANYDGILVRWTARLL